MSAHPTRLVLLGTAGGPLPSPVRSGIAQALVVGGRTYVVDCGTGVTRQLRRARLLSDLHRVFLTHLHSDHVVDIPDLMLTPWSAAPGRKVPLEVWGPDGTRDMMRHLEEAFAFDIHVRRDVDENFSPDGIRVIAHDIQVLFERAFPVHLAVVAEIKLFANDIQNVVSSRGHGTNLPW